MIKAFKRRSFENKLNAKLSIQEASSEIGKIGVKKIAIYYEVKTRDEHKIIKKFKDSLRKGGTIIKTLGYQHIKKGPSTPSNKTFYLNSITWDGIPESPLVDDFLLWKSDILICPLIQHRDCHEYIVKLADSSMKIGSGIKMVEDVYDLSLDLTHEMELSDILSHIIDHLKLLSE